MNGWFKTECENNDIVGMVLEKEIAKDEALIEETNQEEEE
jgi:hypothetical protein